MADIIDFMTAKRAREAGNQLYQAFRQAACVVNLPEPTPGEAEELRAVAQRVAREVVAEQGAAALPEKRVTPEESVSKIDLHDRAAVIKAIRDALRERSGKAWSVKGGRGTAYGWLHISSPPGRRVNHRMTQEDAAELNALLNLDHGSLDYVGVPDSKEYRAEYIARARGEVPAVRGVQYWD